MRLLLDTHTFIWWDRQPAKLSSLALALCQDPANQMLLSVASIWEIHIKARIGKLPLALPLPDLIANQQQLNQIDILSVNLDHVLALEKLPSYHKDPFDRLLMVQAIVENAVLISHDSIFAQYPVNVQW